MAIDNKFCLSGSVGPPVASAKEIHILLPTTDLFDSTDEPLGRNDLSAFTIDLFDFGYKLPRPLPRMSVNLCA